MSITKQIELSKKRFLEALKIIEDKYCCEQDILLFQRNFNHIYKRVSVLFGTDDCQKYIESIMVIDIDKRKGFPYEIWLLIQRIKTENEKIAPPKKEQIEFTFGWYL